MIVTEFNRLHLKRGQWKYAATLKSICVHSPLWYIIYMYKYKDFVEETKNF